MKVIIKTRARLSERRAKDLVRRKESNERQVAREGDAEKRPSLLTFVVQAQQFISLLCLSLTSCLRGSLLAAIAVMSVTVEPVRMQLAELRPPHLEPGTPTPFRWPAADLRIL